MAKKSLAQTISQIIKSKEIRGKIIYSLVILIVFRLLAAIPVVGIPADSIKELFSGNDFGDILSMVSGGVLETASLVAIGLGPYINASVILQLLGSVIPALEELRKEGSQGRRKITLYTRILTVPLAFLQTFVIYSTLRGFGLLPELSTIEIMTMAASLSAGAIVMMWMGELISESGLGGGSSYIIFLGIVASIPGLIRDNVMLMDGVQIVTFIAIYVIIIFAVVFVTETEQRIKVMYSRRVRTTGSTYESFIPLKLTQFGVMPVIFAISLFTFPQIVANFLQSRDISPQVTEYSTKVIEFLSNEYVYNVGVFLLIIGFAFFYVMIVFNVDEYAENLQKQGAFIPGIRPGKPTADYLRTAVYRLTSVGSVFLAFLSILPGLLSMAGVIQTSVISGTGFLIAVSTALEIKRQIESMVVVRSYDKYL